MPLYDDDDMFYASCQRFEISKVSIEEVYTPFPVHGLDKAIGLRSQLD